MAARKQWVDNSFEAFRAGTFGNGGQNLYVSRKGVLQRIYQYDLIHHGYFDLVFANCQNHHEAAPSFVYKNPLGACECIILPAKGAVSGAVADLTGSGFKDLIVCNCSDAAAPFSSSDIYFGSQEDYSEKRHIKIPAPLAQSVAAGDFNGSGAPSLAFCLAVYKQVRVFYHTELGVEWERFVDLPIECDQIAAGDLDGDGYDDLIVRKENSTDTIVYWGGPDGIRADRFAALPPIDPAEIMQPEEKKTIESDMERKFDSPNLPRVLAFNGRTHVTVSTGKRLVFYAVGKDRQFERVFHLETPLALSAAVGDIHGDGHTDLVVACTHPNPERPKEQQSFIYWGGADGFSEDRRTSIQTLQACDVAVHDLDGDGCAEVIVCQSNIARSYTHEALIYRGNAAGVNPEPVRLRTEDAQRVFVVENPGHRPEIFFANHFARSSVGFDKAYVYTGGPDGYAPDRRLEVPAWCAVDSFSADINDDGWAELVVCNNSENSIHLDPGSHVHHFGPQGFEPERSFLLPTKAGWGGLCADLDHDGYMDLVFVYDLYKDLIIFHGGPDGFHPDNATIIRLERQDGTRYGSPRWIFAADLNGDGWLDLIVCCITGDRSLILWGGPQGYSLDRSQELAVYHGAAANAADLTGNGYPDLIIGTHTETPTQGELTPHQPHHSFVHIYWNGPDGIRENNKTILRADAADSISVADFNNDGWLDLFITSYHGGKDRDVHSFLYWNREGQFREMDRQLLFTHSGSGCVAADFNQDGYIDLAVANHKVWGDHQAFSSVWWNGPEGFDSRHRTDLPTAGPHGMTAINPGNVLDRGPEEYYTSTPHELGAGTTVEAIEIKGELPPKTWVKARMRFAESATSLDRAAWSPWQEPGPFVGQPASGRFAQYQLALGATLCLRSPRLTEVRVTFR